MEINIDTILAIIGLIVTIIIGYIGVRYTLKYRKKTDIIFLKNSSISLFKTIVKNLDDIEINFKGKKIDENLIIFKGTFFNNGNVDIDNSIVYKPLEIELPKNYNWISHKIISNSEGLEVKLTQLNNKIVFNWDLFKEGEYFTFDSLVEYKSNPEKREKYFDISIELLKGITFDHRITNLKKINKVGSIPQPMSYIAMLIMSMVFLTLIFSSFYVSIGQYLFPSYEIYNEVTINSEQELVKAKAKNDKEINLISLSGNEIKTVSKDEYNKMDGRKIILKKKKINYWYLIFIGLFSIIYLIAFFIFVITEIRKNRLYKKLKNVAAKYDDLDINEFRNASLKFFKI